MRPRMHVKRISWITTGLATLVAVLATNSSVRSTLVATGPPVSISSVPCTVTIGGTQQSGTCSGTFTQNLPDGFAGDRVVEPTSDSSPAAQAEAFQTATATAGTVTRLNVYLTDATTASSVLVGLYTDNAGKPGTLVTSGTIPAPQKNSWNVTSVASKSLTQAKYWIAVSGQGGAVGYRDRVGTGTPAQTYTQNVTALPATWATGPYVASDGPLSAFADSGSTPSPTPTGASTATPTPAVTHTPTPSATPAPTVTPAPTPAPTTTPSGATLFVAPNGNDGSSCTAASSPCQSFARAYAVARPSGDVVSVAAGSYAEQDLNGGTKSITFKGVAGNKIDMLSNNASNAVFDGLDIDAGGQNHLAFYNSANNVLFKNGRIGNVVDEKGALVSDSQKFVFDNVTFHDVYLKTDGVHLECAYIIDDEGIVIRNSTFQSCAVMDVFLTYCTWCSPLPPDWGNGVMENNKFYAPAGFYAVNWANWLPTIHGWTFRNNWLQADVAVQGTWQGGIRCGNVDATGGQLDTVFTQPC